MSEADGRAGGVAIMRGKIVGWRNHEAQLCLACARRHGWDPNVGLLDVVLSTDREACDCCRQPWARCAAVSRCASCGWLDSSGNNVDHKTEK